jgi:hypothetical protein
MKLFEMAHTQRSKIPSSSNMPPIKEKKIDRDLATLAQKLNHCKEKKDDIQQQGHYLMKIQLLLQKRVYDEKDSTKLPPQVAAQLSPDVVEIMKNQRVKNNEQIMEECARILYCLSKLDPSFKKGVGRLFQAMQDHPQNLAIQRASAGAIRNVLAYTAEVNGNNNSDSAPRIASSIGVILHSMDRFPEDVKFWNIALEILAHLPLHPPLKSLFVSSGALQHTLVAMKHHLRYATVQATAYQVLADLSSDSSDEIKRQLLPSIPLLVRGMKQHGIHPKVQRYGCSVLNHLSSMPEIVSVGGIETIVMAMKGHENDIMVQEQSCAALSNLLSHCPVSVMNTMTGLGGIIATVLQAMTRHTKVLEVQRHGLGILSCLCTRDKENYELFLSEGGLNVVLATMTNFQTNVELAQLGCELLKDVTRQSLDFQRAVTAKGGIVVVLSTMRKHLKSIDVQDPAFACMRNICTHKDNRLQVAVDGGVSTLLVAMSVYIEDAAIQAYGCDALGRLAFEPENRQAIESEHGIDAAIQAMKAHRGHAGVQSRAVFLLLAMAEYEPSLVSIKDQQILELLKETRVPPKKEDIHRLEQLIRRVEQDGRTGWFGRKTT